MTAAGTTRKSAVVKQADDGPEIISLKSSPAAEAERRDLFEVDDVMYSIPVSVPVNKALRYMNIGRKQGMEAQIDYALGLLLGEDGYEALMGFDDLTEDDLEAVVNACQKVMTGPVENPKGKRRNG
jgi:hypothetical protein